MIGPLANHNYAAPLEIDDEVIKLKSGGNIPNASRRKRKRRYILFNTLRARISSCCHKWSGKLLLALFTLTILFLIISVVGPLVKTKGASDPREPPTIIDHYDPRENDIINKLFVISGHAIYQKGSPQFNATKWILNEDVMTVRGTDPFLVQRFIMVIFFFQRKKGAKTKGWGNWINIAGSECFWDGVTCDKDGHVEGIKLDDHDLVGTIPTEVGNLQQLKNLDLSLNSFTGVIPTELGALNKLESLILNYNDLIGTVPFQLCSLRDSETLIVLTTDCTEEVTKVICDCCINCRYYDGGIDKSGSNTLPPTKSPHAGSSMGDGVRPLIGREKLIYDRCAQISGNAITLPRNNESPQNFAMHWMINDDKSMVGVGTLYFIQRYVMAIMYFSLCEESWNFHSWLSSSDNECTFQGVACDYNQIINKLTFVDMSMIGKLPPEISRLTRLSLIDFGQNDISGEIPSTWGHLTNMVTLNLRNNKISGTVPESLCNLRVEHRLKNVWVDCNKISCNPKCCPTCSDNTIAPSMIPIIAKRPYKKDEVNTVRPIETPSPMNKLTRNPTSSPITVRPIETPSPVDKLTRNPTSSPITDVVDVATLYHPEEIRLELQKVSALPDYVPNEMRTIAQNWIINDDAQKLSPISQHLKERYILAVLYFVLDGGNWTSAGEGGWTSAANSDNTTWLLANTNACFWGGVICDPGNEFVVRLELPFENLRGSIPHEISQLYHLQYLNLSNNHLKRSIPEQLGQLAQLGE